MGREWKPGDVAVRVGKDGREVRTMVAVNDGPLAGGCVCSPVQAKDVAHWHHANGRWNPIPDDPEHGTYRPLVVIDPEDHEQVERLLRGYSGWKNSPEDLKEYPHYVNEMQAALREFANPTPPKPDEPQGLGAVVEDAKGERWIRRSTDTTPWLHAEGNAFAQRWCDIAAVRVLSEGVTP